MHDHPHQRPALALASVLPAARRLLDEPRVLERRAHQRVAQLQLVLLACHHLVEVLHREVCVDLPLQSADLFERRQRNSSSAPTTSPPVLDGDIHPETLVLLADAAHVALGHPEALRRHRPSNQSRHRLQHDFSPRHLPRLPGDLVLQRVHRAAYGSPGGRTSLSAHAPDMFTALYTTHGGAGGGAKTRALSSHSMRRWVMAAPTPTWACSAGSRAQNALRFFATLTSRPSHSRQTRGSVCSTPSMGI